MRRLDVSKPTAAALLVILLLSIAVRFVNLDAPPTDFHPTRQYNSALMVRGFLVDIRGAKSEAERRIAVENQPDVLEPPVLESITTAAGLALGHESLVVPRVVSIIAWLLAGLFVFLIGRRLMSERAATLATGLFELMPFAVVASRAFQPDPLAVCALLGAVVASMRWAEKPNRRRFVAAAATGALATFLKVDFAPFVLAAHAGVSWLGVGGTRRGLRAVVRPEQVLYVVLCLVPALCWTPYGLLRIGSSGGSTGGYFIPHLLVTAHFWRALGQLLAAVYGLPILALAVVGLVVAPARIRPLFVWALAAIAAYAVLFDYRVETHTYYQLPVIPFVCLAAAIAIDLAISWVGSAGFPSAVRTGCSVLAVVLAVGVVARDDRTSSELIARRQIATYQVIGARLCHPLHAVFVSPAYGYPLAYYGDIGGVSWPNSADVALSNLMGQPLGGASQLLASDRAAGSRYVIATDFSPFAFGDDLKVTLSSYPQVLEGDGYKVWDLRPGEPSGCSGGPT